MSRSTLYWIVGIVIVVIVVLLIGNQSGWFGGTEAPPAATEQPAGEQPAGEAPATTTQ